MAGPFTSVFHPVADTQDDADARGAIGGTGANDTSVADCKVGIGSKDTGKSTHYSRYDLEDPFSGSSLPIDGNIRVLRANVAFKIHTTAVVDSAVGFCRLGILQSAGQWVKNNLAFGLASFPTLNDLPFPSDASDAIVAGVLFNEKFLLNAAMNDNIIYLPITFVAGTTIVIGQGFIGGGGFFGNHLIDLVSELETYVRGANFISPGFGFDRAIGFALDTKNNPVSADEFFRLHHNAGTETGMVLTIEWEHRAWSSLTVESKGIEPLLQVESKDVESLISIESSAVESVISTKSQAVEPKLSVEDKAIEPTITVIVPKGGAA